MSEPDSDPVTFRPALALRLFVGLAGTVGGAVALWQAVTAASGPARHLATIAILLIPVVLASVVLRRRVTIEGGAMRSIGASGTRQVPWSAIRRIDRRRGSFVVETESGPISAGWLAGREVMLRLLVERARLARVYDGLPWGVEERYVPRAQDIGFVPHHARKSVQNHRQAG